MVTVCALKTKEAPVKVDMKITY